MIIILRTYAGKEIKNINKEVYESGIVNKNQNANTTSSYVFEYNVQNDGVCTISAMSTFPSGQGRRIVSFFKNDTEIARNDAGYISTGTAPRIALSYTLEVKRGDVIAMNCYTAIAGIVASDAIIINLFW